MAGPAAERPLSAAESHLSARSGFIGWSAILLGLLGGPFLLFFVSKAVGGALTHCVGEGPCQSVIGLTWTALISCAALFGALGVMTSLILRRRIDPSLSRMGILRALVLTYGLGALFAIMLLALFIGGFLQGELFPSFGYSTSWLWLNFRLPDWGKLVVWSFVVGFSERLMPGVFDQLTERFSQQGEEKAESAR